MRSTPPIDLLYISIMFGCSISTRLFCFLKNLFTDLIGSFPVNLDRAFTTLLSFNLTAVIHEEISVTNLMFLESLLSSYLNPAMVHFPIGLLLLFQWQQLPSNSNSGLEKWCLYRHVDEVGYNSPFMLP